MTDMQTLEDLGMKILVGADPAPTAPTVPEGVQTVNSVMSAVYGVASTVSMGACFYHGLKRNDSVGWGLGWAFLGGLFPVVTPLFALYEGFAVPKALSKRP
jgi:hypothetical protein